MTEGVTGDFVTRGGGPRIPRSFHIKDYPSREAQWVAAVKAWRKRDVPK